MYSIALDETDRGMGKHRDFSRIRPVKMASRRQRHRHQRLPNHHSWPSMRKFFFHII